MTEPLDQNEDSRPANGFSSRVVRQQESDAERALRTSPKPPLVDEPPRPPHLPPDTHFMPAPVSQPEYGEGEIFFEPIKPERHPEPIHEYPWLVKSLPRRATQYIPLITLAVAALVFSMGAWAYFVASGPNDSAIERRLNEGDAQGADYQYRAEILVQRDPEAERQSLPDEAALWTAINGTIAHRQSRFLAFSDGAMSEPLQDALAAPSEPGRRQIVPAHGLQFDVQDHSGRTYWGEVNTDPPTSFRLRLDSLHRFELLILDVGDVWVRVVYSYDGSTFAALSASQSRSSATIEARELANPEAAVSRVSLRLGASTAAQPSDLEMRFVDANGTVVRAVGFDWTLDADGYYFRWKDENSNGVVDQGDVITVKSPDASLEPRVWDRWNGAYAQAATQNTVPAAGGALMLLALGSFACVGWLRSRRLT